MLIRKLFVIDHFMVQALCPFILLYSFMITASDLAYLGGHSVYPFRTGLRVD